MEEEVELSAVKKTIRRPSWSTKGGLGEGVTGLMGRDAHGGDAAAAAAWPPWPPRLPRPPSPFSASVTEVVSGVVVIAASPPHLTLPSLQLGEERSSVVLVAH